MVNARSQYKWCIRKAKYDYDNKKTHKLLETKQKNARLYWKTLKSYSGVKDANISIDVFERYFKAVKKPYDPFIRLTKT